MQIIDLRSDTVTQPTPSMRKALAEAEVGDDVFGEDVTVNRLEKMAAERMGKEAALFVASGTMANIVSQMSHCGRGDEMIIGDQSHIFFYEQGGSAAIGGIHPRTLPNQPDGTLPIQEIEAAIRPADIHFPKTRLIVLENTHNRCGGAPIDIKYMKAVRDVARAHGLAVHVDGARIFNAAISLGVDARDLVAPSDSVGFCLSKGLAAPVGSVVCGTDDFILEARRIRKMLGGGMRQAGILAAAGIVSLNEMIDRLAEDHANAQLLAWGLADMNGLSIQPERVRTNMVYAEVTQKDMPSTALAKKLETEGVRLLPVGPNKLRAVTHYHVTSDDIGVVLNRMSKALS